MWRGCGRQHEKEGRFFFFEERKQKTFDYLERAGAQEV
jgi:hypothetical protein